MHGVFWRELSDLDRRQRGFVENFLEEEEGSLMSEEMTYRSAGVDIEAGYEAVRRIKGHARANSPAEVVGGIGSFGGLFALLTGSSTENLSWSAGTDGVGTKLKIAFMTGRHDTIGIDAVAYCVNDIICQGAEPLFFLDYLAVGRLDPEMVGENRLRDRRWGAARRVVR